MVSVFILFYVLNECTHEMIHTKQSEHRKINRKYFKLSLDRKEINVSPEWYHESLNEWIAWKWGGVQNGCVLGANE